MLTEVMDMLEEIQQGYDDDYSWVDQDFVDSLSDYLEKYGNFTDKQIQAIKNIYKGGA